MYLANFADQISRGSRKVLAFPLVHMSPDHVTIGTVEFGIDVQKRLNIIITGRYVAQALRGKSLRILIENGRGPGLLCRHVGRKDGGTMIELQAWLGRVGFCDENKHPTGDRRGMEVSGEGDFETR